jgi:hypothetical protein
MLEDNNNGLYGEYGDSRNLRRSKGTIEHLDSWTCHQWRYWREDKPEAPRKASTYCVTASGSRDHHLTSGEKTQYPSVDAYCLLPKFLS